MAYTEKRNKNGEKLYPFSMIKNGHNVELAYNHQFCICDDMENGIIPYDQKAFDYFERLSEVYAKAMGNPIYWCIGKEYAILKEASVWATCYRDRRNAG